MKAGNGCVRQWVCNAQWEDEGDRMPTRRLVEVITCAHAKSLATCGPGALRVAGR